MNKIYNLENSIEKENLFVQRLFEFIKYKDKNEKLSPVTCKGYWVTLKKVISIIRENNPKLKTWEELDEVSIRYVIRNYKKDNDEPISNRSRAHLISLLKSLYNFLLMKGYIEKSPLYLIKTTKFSKNLPQFINNEQFEQIINLESEGKTKDFRDCAILELLYATGIRLSELLNIKICDIDFVKQEILILGKGNKERIVPFGEYALKALLVWMNIRETFSPTCDNVFINKFGNPLSSRAVQLMMKEKGKNLELPISLSPHKLRHSCATEMVSRGGDLRVVQEILGHSSLSVTQMYLHVDVNYLKKEYSKSHPLEKAIEKEQ